MSCIRLIISKLTFDSQGDSKLIINLMHMCLAALLLRGLYFLSKKLKTPRSTVKVMRMLDNSFIPQKRHRISC
jgi:hypothetical protein